MQAALCFDKCYFHCCGKGQKWTRNTSHFSDSVFTSNLALYAEERATRISKLYAEAIFVHYFMCTNVFIARHRVSMKLSQLANSDTILAYKYNTRVQSHIIRCNSPEHCIMHATRVKCYSSSMHTKPLNDRNVQQHFRILLGCCKGRGEKLELNYWEGVVTLHTSMWECN